MDMWTTSNEKIRSIDCSALQSHIDYDGKHFKILHLHPRSPVWRSKERVSDEDSYGYYPVIECGPASLVGSGIPEWFNDKSTNSSFGTIQLHSDLGTDIDQWRYGMGYAVFIVYEFHEPHTHTHPRKRRKVKVDERKGNSNSTTSDGTNSNFPIFLCHFKVNGVDAEKPLVLFAPVVPSVGPNGFWVRIRARQIQRFFSNRYLGGMRSLGTSITTGSLNVEVKECGARVVRDQNDAYQVLNTISPRGLDLQSFENIRSWSLVLDNCDAEMKSLMSEGDGTGGCWFSMVCLVGQIIYIGRVLVYCFGSVVRLAGVAFVVPVVNYTWPSLPDSLIREDYRRKLVQCSIRFANYAPKLLYWWVTQKWLPSTSTLERNPIFFNDRDIDILKTISGFAMLTQDKLRERGVFDTLCRDFMLAFGKWEFDPMDLSNPYPQNESSMHI
ncbi:hypothetical protein FH972_010025 [Carpinus fangiana]|uniref:Uncharacterized protein n=1 Tax=Carpinus fangiana TaxID=176857 RepID=A0A660KNZ6_9ROSI|nr:hypothetical protein FH972_010025 [Carpinus fangiana]